MTAMAAARLGYRCHIYCPDKDAPASHVAAATTVAAYDDLAALEAFAQAVDVVTFEFENVPASAGEKPGGSGSRRGPTPRVLHLTQQRLREKNFLSSINVPDDALPRGRAQGGAAAGGPGAGPAVRAEIRQLRL